MKEENQMNIVGALKRVKDMRVSCDDRWLVWNISEWVVYQRKYHAKKTQIIYHSKNQRRAIKALVEGEQNGQR